MTFSLCSLSDLLAKRAVCNASIGDALGRESACGDCCCTRTDDLNRLLLLGEKVAREARGARRWNCCDARNMLMGELADG